MSALTNLCSTAAETGHGDGHVTNSLLSWTSSAVTDHFLPVTGASISLKPWCIRAATLMRRASACSTGRGHWGWFHCNSVLSSPAKRNALIRLCRCRHNFNLNVSQDFWFGQDLLWGEKKPKNLPCIINELSSFCVYIISSVSKYLKTLQNATNHFWNFKVPNISKYILIILWSKFILLDSTQKLPQVSWLKQKMAKKKEDPSGSTGLLGYLQKIAVHITPKMDADKSSVFT